MSSGSDWEGFDHFMVVDWSAKSSPSPKKATKDAIWIGEGSRKRSRAPQYFRTRATAVAYLHQRLYSLARRKKRVLVGWDFAFGYPKGFSKALRLPGKRPWRSVWELLSKHIKDKADNRNNRFTVAADLNCRITGGGGPFWGIVGKEHSGVLLRPTKDFSYPIVTRRAKLAERRLVEMRVRRMQPPWKLAYTGSVGSQALLGIPRLMSLVRDPKLFDYSVVWPFETKFAAKVPEAAPLIVHAEIYPSHLKLPKRDAIPDREQVKYYVRWLREEQHAGQLRGWLAGPEGLSKKQRRRVLRHEGWVLGIK